MAERPIDSLDSLNLSDSFLGNTNTFILELLVKDTDTAGDILTSPRLPGGLVYTSMEVRTVGNTAGLSLDIGWRGDGEHRSVVGDGDVFADGITVATTGKQQVMGKSYAMNNANNRQVSHVLTFKLLGTLTEDETVEVLVNCIDAGRI